MQAYHMSMYVWGGTGGEATASARKAAEPAAPLAAEATPVSRVGRAPNIQHKPTVWVHIGDWPDPLAVVDGVAIARKDVVADLQAAVEDGTLADDIDEMTGLRAAATALEARVDSELVRNALQPPEQAKIAAKVTAETRREQARAGGSGPWLEGLKRQGQTEISHARWLEQQAGLELLVARLAPVTVTEAELLERFAAQKGALSRPAAWRVREQVVADGGKELPAAEQAWRTDVELGDERLAALKSLKPKTWSAPFQTRDGKRRIQWLEKRPAKVPTFAEAKARMLAYVTFLRTWDAGHAILLRLRNHAKVQRMSPFDKPPGGLPVATDVTPAAFEEEDD